VRDGARHLGPALVAVAALGVGTVLVARPASHAPDHSWAAAGQRSSAYYSAAQPAEAEALTADEGVTVVEAYARAAAGKAGGPWLARAGVQPSHAAGVPSTAVPSTAVQVAQAPAASAASATAQVRPLRKLRPADVLVVAPTTLGPTVAAAIRRLPGVTAAARIDAATIRVNGKFVQMLGVSPSGFRAFAAGPTARSTSLWRSVANGDIAVSDTMGKQDKLPLGSSVSVAGATPATLRVGGYGTVGIAGVDAVVSDSVARSLGIPADNAMVISAPHARLAALMKKVKAAVPHGAGIAQLVAQAEPGAVVSAQAVAAGAAGSTAATAGAASPLTPPRMRIFLKAALSRVGMPYVWGAAGPTSFDCSGLVQWSMRQAGIIMPRVAVDQARTGPRVPLSQLAPGDLLFYHTDATAPTYISHVAIYLGNGLMVQAPEPGMDVQVVKADFGMGFAGAVRVSPALAASVAGDPAG
jgi:cell wall-associated NlpC family hydrolase